MHKIREFGEFHFSIEDYCVFSLMLILSTGIGVYFGYFKRRRVPIEQDNLDDPIVNKRKSTDFGSRTMSEYLLGSRKLNTFPVAMSLVASYISGVTILGTPSEIYNYGTQYWLIIVAIMFMAVAVSTLYLPVFCKLRVGSSYEYLELRFNSAIRSIASFMFVMDEIIFLPIILYVPSIAFNQVTGVNVYVISTVVCVVCIFYTLIGGIKAVVHTDAWQVFVMFIAVIVVVILGTVVIGGLGEVFKEASEGGRLIFFDTNPSPYQRHTIWSVLIGGFFYWTSFNSVNQTMVQRYMSLPTLHKAQKSIIIFIVGIALFVSVCVLAGLLIFAFYRYCDPLTAGLIKNDDQLFPIYVMQTVGHLKGVPGLFIAGVFGAALSSLSVVLNSTALVLLEDIVRGCFKVKLSERSAGYLVKGSIVVLGIVAMSLVFIVEKLGAILSVATSMTAIAAGTTFGLFTLGMLVPWCNTKGAMAGAIAGILMSGWISIGSQIAVIQKRVMPHKLEILVTDCPNNITSGGIVYPDESDVFPLFRLSFHWITPIGVASVLIVGVIVSLLTGPTKKVDPNLISPVMHRFLSKDCFPPPNAEMDIHRESTVQTLTHLLGEGTSTAEGHRKENQGPGKY